MKSSVIRSCATLGLVGSITLGAWFGSNQEALALSEEQIVQKLQQVPVFTVADQDGSPLVAALEEDQARVAGVFISQQDAQEFVERLKNENPDLGNQVQVVPVSLGEIYKLDQENESQSESLDFAYVPMPEQVQSAESLLREQGKQVEQFNGVPLFVARGGEKQGYLTLQQNNQPIIPLFFEKEQLQQMVDRFKQQQPDQASSVTIEVVPLESVLATMQQSDDEQLGNLVIVPSRESIQFLRSLPQQNQQQNQPAQPAQ